MICQSCAAELTAEAKFCHRCGNDVELTESPNQAVANKIPTDSGEKANRGANLMTPKGGGDDVERDLWVGGYSSKAMIGQMLLGGAISLALLVAGVLLIGPTGFLGIMVAVIAIALIWAALGLLLLVRKWSVQYRLTSNRFIHQTGILRRVTNRIEVIDMDDVTYSQGLVQRLVGVGSIKISSSDRTHPTLHIRGIENVAQVADIIDAAQRKERVRRGIHIESN